MIRNSIIGKLWISMVALIVIVLVLLSLGLSGLLEDFYFSQIAEELVGQGIEIARVIGTATDSRQLTVQLDLLTNITNAHIMLVDKSGVVEACDSMMGMSSGAFFGTEDFEKVFQGEIVTKRGYHYHFDAPMLSAAIPIYEGQEINYALTLYRPVAPISKTINSMRWLVVYGAIGAILLASVVSFFLSRTLSRPLVQMNKVATEMAKGNFEHKIKVNSKDEVGLLGTSLNYMSERLKNNISELSHEKKKLENILASMSDGVITLDASGKIILINPPAGNLLMKSMHNFNSGQNFLDSLIPADFKSMFEKVYIEKKMQKKDIEIAGKIISVRMTPLLDERQSLIGVVGILQDVTKDRELEIMRRDFIANVSHELRTPLSLMQGYTEAMLDGMAEDVEKRNKMLSIIHQETLRLKRMVDELLDLSRLQTGNFTLNKQELNFSEILFAIEEKYKPKVENTGIDFKIEIEPDLPPVYADHDRMQQVLINLIENALRHTDKGYISISAYKENEQVCVEVTDTGTGIAPEDLDFIWERFYKADKSRQRSKGGTGLGLAIVQNIVKAHNGKVWVRSEVGKGSTFGFCVPINKSIK
ncbi:MAG: cell wall metabolism sensor histidine kinase WalK [Clostridia bacterium]|nr:cell wall metabolism sensor histidine kinase WalK [Clostridia bacterium]